MSKKILLLVGPSGVGKTVVGEELEKQGIPKLVSHTTRKKRINEEENKSYHFVTEEEFNNIEKFESACYAGNWYGLSKKEINDKLKSSDIVYAIVEKQGAEKIKKEFQNQAIIIYLISDVDLLKQRMKQRGDTDKDIEKRINNIMQTKELENNNIADLIIENNSTLDVTVNKILNIIK